MTRALTPVELDARLFRALANSRAVTSRAAQLSAASRRSCDQSARLLLAGAARRKTPALDRWRGGLEGFRIEGRVDGVRTVATFQDGRLACSAELAARAEVVVAMGETFDSDGDGEAIAASLDGSSTALMLTLMRAFSSIDAVQIAAGAHGDCWSL
jgi:hypothetical protein